MPNRARPLRGQKANWRRAMEKPFRGKTHTKSELIETPQHRMIPGLLLGQALRSAPRLFGVSISELVSQPTYERRRLVIETLPGRPLSLQDRRGFVELGKRSGVTRGWIKKNSDTIVQQLARATAELYLKGIKHGDIHKNNILLQNIRGKPRVRLIDFDSAEMITPRTTRLRRDYTMAEDITECLYWGQGKSESSRLKQLFRHEFLRALGASGINGGRGSAVIK